jgi:type I restriction enzyme R subunit
MYLMNCKEQLGDEMEMYSYLFKSEELKQKKYKRLKKRFFITIQNMFSTTNRATTDKELLRLIKETLRTAKG